MQPFRPVSVVLEPDTIVSIWRNFSQDPAQNTDPKSPLAGTVVAVLSANDAHVLVLDDRKHDLARAYQREFGQLFQAIMDVLPSQLEEGKIAELVQPQPGITFPEGIRHRVFMDAAVAVRPTYLVVEVPEVMRDEEIVRQVNGVGVTLITPQDYTLL